ncbi:type II toxin-antitoxin system VapC family toxin [Sphingomonas qomolangmaensis]|uniref:Type II toxin-antitoxin system VapC family toxin n=1 Tax=Sphingomonas qomolangmaensis TaxID=2918765 RepID=A0ABY5LC17_9SPHN|nr:type II toxin-antitoxin system VapC family toxin [Sphingomonas qomolangmaensis]UUL83370.1 type II toxin-antitoxin system VapC family toxin [Sphingomonas qomolangmaensis]
MIALFDTSVIVCLILQESGYQPVQDRLVDLSLTVRFSDFGKGEFAAAVGAKVRAGTIGAAAADTMLTQLDTWLTTDAIIPITSADIKAATGFIRRFETGLRLPDAIHIAVAYRIGCPIVSLDRIQLHAALACGVVPLHPLEIANAGE